MWTVDWTQFMTTITNRLVQDGIYSSRTPDPYSAALGVFGSCTSVESEQIAIKPLLQIFQVESSMSASLEPIRHLHAV